ncbi:MAG: methylated-DNA--[protein]-cysteine S-methyltransferase [Chakrabartia sp.]
MRRPTATACFKSPLGLIRLDADDRALLAVRLPRSGAPQDSPPGDIAHPILRRALDQLGEYFAGQRQAFDLPLHPPAGSEGAALRAGIAAIPYGETRTYGDIAAQCGSIARAVGQACKTNAFPLLIPCHRVTSAAGPEYYSAGDGPRTKSWLLDFEYDHLPLEKRTRLI